MGKFYGEIGYGETIETSPGVWEEKIVKRMYYGDIIRTSRRWDRTDRLNDDLNITNQISILADAYANEHFAYIRYVEWMKCKWKVTDVEVQRPRLILTLGGVYNE